MSLISTGTVVGGHYQIINHLGGGAFGQTYVAIDLHLPNKPKCVVKQFKPKKTSQGALSKAKDLFDKEADVLYKLGEHTQIPRLLAHFEDDYEFYLVQELIEGDCVEKILNGKKILSENQTINMLSSLLKVLEFVHSQHIIHRDIKPSNLIKRSRGGHIVLIDFGAIKERTFPSHPDASPTTTISIGTKGYMPNEQANGKPQFSSDLYSVGVVGIQAVTGELPDEDSYTGELSWRNKAQTSSEFADFLDKMVCCDYRQRYETAAVAREFLREIINTRRIALQEKSDARKHNQQKNYNQNFSRESSTEEQVLVPIKRNKLFGIF